MFFTRFLPALSFFFRSLEKALVFSALNSRIKTKIILLKIRTLNKGQNKAGKLRGDTNKCPLFISFLSPILTHFSEDLAQGEEKELPGLTGLRPQVKSEVEPK